MTDPDRPLPRGLRAAARVAAARPPRVESVEGAGGRSSEMRDLGPDWMVRFARMHPICERCYDRRYPGRPPVRMKPDFADVEQCCDCGSFNSDGIQIRDDPRRVQYPKRRDS